MPDRPSEAVAATSPRLVLGALFDRHSAPGSLERQARRRMLVAIAVAGLLALFSSSAFYLFEVERATRQQSAALAHYLGQIVRSTEADWQKPAAASVWQSDPAQQRFLRQRAGASKTLPLILDHRWLAAQSRPDLRLFLATADGGVASSLGEAGAGEILALAPLASGLIRRGEQLFVQAPLRWDDSPGSPLLVAQQRLSLIFSLGEIAASGLLFWAFLAGLIWITVGIWLQDALRHVQFLAYHDPLTGLINRAALLVGLDHMLAESRRNGACLALLYLDLDRFKNINDSLGHAAGDQVLIESARRLGACVRDADFVARLGGDEFVVVLGELRQPQDATPIARAIIQALAAPIDFNGQPLHTGATIGIALFPNDGDQRDELLSCADSAMYAAKQAGRGSFRHYDRSLGAEAEQRLRLEEGLRQAIELEDFELHYQPIVTCRPQTQLVGFEALIRWPDGNGQYASPERFIPLAEESGLIVPLGDWVLRTACRQMQTWRSEMSAAFGPLTMAVNVSLKQLLSDDFPERVATILAETGLPVAHLELEITEGLYAERYDRVPGILADLRAIGLRLSIDDFGTGYSALANLTRLPVNRLKIDRSFIRNIASRPDELTLARTIVAIGRQLGIEVIAEGVENAEQMVLLVDSGCEYMQGWLFSKALPANAVPDWIVVQGNGEGVR